MYRPVPWRAASWTAAAPWSAIAAAHRGAEATAPWRTTESTVPWTAKAAPYWSADRSVPKEFVAIAEEAGTAVPERTAVVAWPSPAAAAAPPADADAPRRIPSAVAEATVTVPTVAIATGAVTAVAIAT